MTEAPKDLGSPGEPGAGKKEKRYDLGFRLVTIAWGTGAFVYGWLLAGILYDREYWKLTCEALGWADWSLAGLFGFAAGGLSFWASSVKESAEKESKQLFRIVVAVLPALFLVSALAVLTLTLATYNDDWREARQGIATAFAALIAAVGVVVSVAVSYKTGEENRLLQKQTEQQKLDAELIKSLNDRLHEIISRRYGDKLHEVSASYFQLAALYRDWETLADNSELVKNQKGSQQRNILKLLFGVYQESDEKNSSERSDVDILTLDSVIQDIFPLFEEGADKESSSAQKEETESKTPDGQQGAFDLSYLDLRGLDLSGRDLRGANLIGAHLEGEKTSLVGACLDDVRLNYAHLKEANLEGAHLKEANLEGAHLAGAELKSAHLEEAKLWGANLAAANLEGAHLEEAKLWSANLAAANLQGANLAGADLRGAHLEEAELQGANLEDANLQDAHLEEADLDFAYLARANLQGANLEDAYLGDAHLDKASFSVELVKNPQDPEARSRVIDQLKASKMLPAEAQLLKAEGFDQALVDQIIQAHKEQLAKKSRLRLSLHRPDLASPVV